MLKNIARSASIVGVGDIASRIPLYLAELIIIKGLTQAEYSIWAVTQLFLVIIPFSQLGLISGYSRIEPSISKKNDNNISLRRLQTIIISAVILALIATFPVLLILSTYVDVQWSANIYFAYFLLSITVVLILVINSEIASSLRWRFMASIRITFSMIFLFLSLVGIFLDMGIGWYLYCLVASYLASSALYYNAKQLITVAVKFRMHYVKLYFSKGIPFYFQGLVKVVAQNLDRLFVFHLFSASSIAIYGFSFAVSSLGAVIPLVLSKIIMPTYIVSQIGNKEAEFGILEAVKKLHLISFAIAVLVSIAVYFLLPAFDGRYSESGKLAAILSISAFLYSASQSWFDIIITKYGNRKVQNFNILFIFLSILTFVLAFNLLGRSLNVASYSTLLLSSVYYFYSFGLIVNFDK